MAAMTPLRYWLALNFNGDEVRWPGRSSHHDAASRRRRTPIGDSRLTSPEPLARRPDV